MGERPQPRSGHDHVRCRSTLESRACWNASHLDKGTLDTVNRGITEKSKDFVQFVAIADDVHFIGRPLRAVAAFDVFLDLATQAGLWINPSKSKLLWKHSARLPEAQQALDSRVLSV